jgi:C4-type Zn-finger protein
MSDKENGKIMQKHIRLLHLTCPSCGEKGTMRAVQYPDLRTRSMILMLFCTHCGYPFIVRGD